MPGILSLLPQLSQPLIRVMAVVLCGHLSLTAVLAAPAPEIEASTKQPGQSGEQVLRVQRSLQELGLYLGPVTGRMNAETRAAIRLYQQTNGLIVDGTISIRLNETLENTINVRNLLSKLGKARKQKTNAARAALLSHPATRDLINNDPGERANAARDTKSCLRAPTVRCLLKEATETAKAIYKTELRDWALGEILIVQGRAGLSQEAMETAGRIHDPRLIMVALGDIAKALAMAGQHKNAKEAVAIIPDEQKRMDTGLAVARIYMENGQKNNALETLQRLESDITGTADLTQRIQLQTRKALILWQLGEQDRARKDLDLAAKLAGEETNRRQNQLITARIATTYARINDPDRALKLLGNIDKISTKTPALMKVVDAEARQGDYGKAFATAANIPQMRYRVIALGNIAGIQIKTGNLAAAKATLNRALDDADSIRLSYARSFAYSHLAIARSRLGFNPPQPDHDQILKAISTAQKIKDNRLRAKTLWRIAGLQKKSGDIPGAEKTRQLARQETGKIISVLSRVWVLSQYSHQSVRRNDRDDANMAFQEALDVARTIDNPWSRARALARLASTLLELAGFAQPENEDNETAPEIITKP